METSEQLRRASGVLNYLRAMMDYCRLEHRHEIEREYEEAWSLAAQKLYGPLPDRWQMEIRRRTIPTQYCPEKPEPTAGQLRSWATPLRKVIRTITETTQQGRSTHEDRYLVLECGHRVREPLLYPDAPEPKRRRCKECRDQMEASKKPAASVPASSEKRKSASA
ncbi:MAG TPA: hypothetical protein VJN64_15115 [Terriglobales bacterium]|nr:hypothetical protein [Terriglobales bacterium]